jgi:diguanylate cyclase (GGDEF)-like protein
MVRALFTSLSFFQKQLITVVGVSVLSLGVMSGLLYANFIGEYRDNLVELMRSKAVLLAGTSRSAVLFEDQESAARILSSLDQYASTRYAKIYDANMALFAEYSRAGERADPSLEELENGVFFKDQNIYVTHKIFMDDDYLGMIVISADTDSLQVQQRRYVWIASLVFLATTFLAYLLNWRLQKLLSKPVGDLIGLVRHVAEHKSYERRLDVDRADEIGDLMQGVNAMLDTIQKHEIELYQRAHYDELTKLPNRHLLMERVSRAISAGKRHGTGVAILFLDLDRFKVINDSLGHAIGDQLLVQVAGKLVDILRESDSVCRWGGDEFVMVLEDVHRAEDVEKAARKVIAELSKPFFVGDHYLQISTSIGIACFPQDGDDGMTLMKHADISMYQAKARGVGEFRFFSSDMLGQSMRRLTVEMKVRKALEEGEFSLVYQPQVSAQTDDIAGFEALLRWDAEVEFSSPAEFLPVIEEVGLMDQLSRWVLEQACEQNVSWQKAGLPRVKVAVNLPVSFISKPHCLDSIKGILEKTGLEPQYLELEITEENFMVSTSIARDVLEPLNELGVIIAIDDFGTGYSSMSYLQELPIGVLKIDGSFVRALGESKAAEGIVQSIITLGKSLDLTIVAECVETSQQLGILKSMGCDIIQGYLYSRPLSAREASGYLLCSRVEQGRELSDRIVTGPRG